MSSRIPITILRHTNEIIRRSNSGRLIQLAIDNATIIDYGRIGQPVEALTLPYPPDASTYLLFPEGPVCDQLPVPMRHLVVLDASWSQVRRMRHRVTALRGIQPLHVRADASVERMRESPGPNLVSTIEAVAAALRLAGDDVVARHLDDTFVRYVRALRG